MPVTNEEILDAILRRIAQASEPEGITPIYLAKKLKWKLNAKEDNVFEKRNENVVTVMKT